MVVIYNDHQPEEAFEDDCDADELRAACSQIDLDFSQTYFQTCQDYIFFTFISNSSFPHI